MCEWPANILSETAIQDRYCRYLQQADLGTTDRYNCVSERIYSPVHTFSPASPLNSSTGRVVISPYIIRYVLHMARSYPLYVQTCQLLYLAIKPSPQTQTGKRAKYIRYLIYIMAYQVDP
jgi:hypothetical protein